MSLKKWSLHYPVSGKMNLDAFLSTHYSTLDYLLEKRGGDITAAVRDGWELGRKAGSMFFIKFSEDLKRHGKDLNGLARILNAAYQSISSKKFDKIIVEEGSIAFEDYKCPICGDYTLPDELKKEGRVCIVIDGIFVEMCNLMGLKAESWETKCRAAGDEYCRHELKITK
ncbi:MAG: hypothetical protein KIH01_08575 [Candidatus Freyarchaeota archaeon]|nr:hypothetical protein [Candidatus Jordarchaeia archaeon]